MKRFKAGLVIAAWKGTQRSWKDYPKKQWRLSEEAGAEKASAATSVCQTNPQSSEMSAVLPVAVETLIHMKKLWLGLLGMSMAPLKLYYCFHKLFISC